MNQESKYLRVGDFVSLWEGCYGIVLATSEDDRQLNHYPITIWSDMKKGYLILTNEIGLSHYDFEEPGLSFITNHYSDICIMSEKLSYRRYLEDLIEKLKESAAQ